MKDSFRIHASDGYSLSVTGFIPRKYNGTVVLINSATGVKQEYYSDFATHLADHGFRVFTYDYRGIGHSKPLHIKGFKASMHEWGTLDYHSVLKHLFLTYTDSQFVVIGHSVGGQLIGMSPLSENVDQVIAVGAQAPFYRLFAGGLSRMKHLFFWYMLIPVLTRVFGYFPASGLRLFEDLPAGVALQWASWAKNRNYLFDELPFMKERFRALHQHALMISFTDDTYAPARAVENLMKHFSNLKWDHWSVAPRQIEKNTIGHFGFFKHKTGSALWHHLMQRMCKSVQITESKAA
ncbi:MAG TPA: alpha/beta fold hydrolase [Chryseosolibacter sp.]|nr:alpha/beta fold hydrolase [Chryseosolibacter sp.]